LFPRLAGAALAAARGVPDHRWLDRLVRGRAWIPVLGVLLAGIVATQVEVLKLGASEGRWVSRTAALSASNQTLQANVARLSDDQRITSLAARMGMVMPAPTAITFLHRPRPGEVRSALARMRAADPTQFESNLQATGG
jgi:cell division protein FtsB